MDRRTFLLLPAALLVPMPKAQPRNFRRGLDSCWPLLPSPPLGVRAEVYAVYAVAYDTGARFAEIMQARTADIDFEAGTITLAANATKNGKRVVLAGLTARTLDAIDAVYDPSRPYLFRCEGREQMRRLKRIACNGRSRGAMQRFPVV